MRIAEKHIRHYNRLNGNLITKKALVKFHAALKKDIDSRRIDAHVPFGVECLDIEKKLAKAITQINGHTMQVELKPIKLTSVKVVHTKNDIEPVKKKSKKEKRKAFKPKSRGKKTKVVNAPKLKRESKRPLPPVDRNKRGKAAAEPSINLKPKVEKRKPKMAKSLNGLAGADQLTSIQFYEHDLGPFKKEFHRLNSDSNVMIWGQPGHGKTVKLLQLAQHFANNGKKVLYVAEEEYGKSTLAEKLTTFKIGHPNLSFSGELVEDHLAHFDVIFFDSVNSMGLTSHDVKRLDKKYPNKLFFLIVQTTKEGDFRGGRDWEHIVDIAGEIRNRKLILRKNRLDSNFKTKADKLMVDALVEEQKQKQQIKKLVKEQTEPAEPVSM
ncbi:MAG: hypothetical protein QY309_04855 [Cyclobacteriaceae bacterium]|nr:MAG: hypothetical protein QY309_04855 [Cyclobacteriaceae bacterium]